jgi:hypothetical protein
VPAPRPAPEGNRVWDLTLHLSLSRPSLDLPLPAEFAKMTKVRLELVNHSDRPRRIGELEVADRLRPQGQQSPGCGNARGMSFVFRFDDGTVYEFRPTGVVGSQHRRPLLVPLRLEAKGRATAEGDLWNLLSDSEECRRAVRERRRFCVTAVVEEMGLKSNTAFVNGAFLLPKGYDALEDARAFRATPEGQRIEERLRFLRECEEMARRRDR